MGILIFYFSLAFGMMMIPKYIRYKDSDYKVASGNSFFKTLLDKGNYGEVLTFSYLEKLGSYHKH
ncbi:MAG: hypothetical protein N4A57_05385 [Anaeromicrobium sp.]|jgi:uncharacterized membrane protein YfcA|uniref:hypothetical protein n=1 Tax=Anaeromicrobium sp. TaxID=1929132 RepID=UPI0025CDA467|nr:hypothetical protein [Anaeromicrobium sp.]MCT4593685.1 hypothetical protein [Anaeromicrobium sp.]